MLFLKIEKKSSGTYLRIV